MALANGAFLVVGSVVLVSTANLNVPTVFEASFYPTVLLLVLLLLAAPAYDAKGGAHGDHARAPAAQAHARESSAR